MRNMFENDWANQSSEGSIKDCHFCWWHTKGLIVAVTMIALAGCQPATTPSSSVPAVSKTAPPSDQIRSAVNRTAPSNSSPDISSPDISSTESPLDAKTPDPNGTTDLAAANAIMDSIIWQFQTDDKVIETTEPMIPIGADPSLSDDALDAAFALLSSRIRPQSFEPVFEMLPKAQHE